MAVKAGLASFVPTHVQYDELDSVGYLLALASLSPVFLAVSYATCLVTRREVAVGSAFLGQLLNEALNWACKRTIKGPRPTTHVGSGYGMPSSHAQFVGYFAVYFVLYSYTRLPSQVPAVKHLTVLLVVALSLIVSYSRIYLHYHTTLQVFIGYVMGVAFGLGWHALTERVLRPRIWPKILALPLARAVYLRDSAGIPNVWRWEWEGAMRALSNQPELDSGSGSSAGSLGRRKNDHTARRRSVKGRTKP